MNYKGINKSRRRALIWPITLNILLGVFALFISLFTTHSRYHFGVIVGWVLTMAAGIVMMWWRMTHHIDEAIEASAQFERDLCEQRLRPVHVEDDHE